RKVRSVGLGGGDDLFAVLSGVGAEKARSAARWLIGSGADALLSIGIAGGLSPDVKPGDIVIAEKVIGEETGAIWRADGAVVKSACETLKGSSLQVLSGAVITTARPTLSAGEKEDLYMRSGALAVDMESAAVARAAAKAGVPFFAMRAVSDEAGRSVSRDIYDCLDEEGGVRSRTLMNNILRRPSMVQEMLGLRTGFKSGLSALEAGWGALVKHGITSSFVPVK
ncbi:MAG: hypothetical protein ACE5EB_06535, partial [Thermodesulfobacteriota bacterium]